MNMRITAPTSLISTSHSIEINWKLCEIIGQDVFALWNTCDLGWRSTSLRLYSKCRVYWYLLSYHVWSKSVHNHLKGQQILLCTVLVTPSQGQDHWKCCKMVEVKGAHKHAIDEEFRLQVCTQCPTWKFIPCKTAGWPAGQQAGWT